MCALEGCQSARTAPPGLDKSLADLDRTEEVQGGRMVILSHNRLGPSQDLREISRGRCGVGR